MSTFKSKSNSLEALVRTALLNGELAPGVAKQINGYREGLLPRDEKRLLTILDDAIADGFVTVIQPLTQTATVMQTVSRTALSA